MSFLTKDYLRTAIKNPPSVLTGLDSWVQAMFGMYKGGNHTVLELLKSADEIDAQASHWKDMSDEALSDNLVEFKESFRRRKKGYEGLVPKAFAAIREAADRRLGLRPYVVQLAGALALHRGYAAEMATGEGKTLTASLPAIVNGWIGLPCHIITVNDYLANRDAEWLAPLYKFCGVSVGCVTSDMEPEARKEGYNHDVTYTTSKEIVADFLRDRLWMGNLQKAGRRQIASLLGRQSDVERGIVMRGIHFAIVDEADSILIDEAVTPLIIARATPDNVFVEACKIANDIAATLKAGVDYRIDRKYNEINLDPKLKGRIEERLKQSPGMFSGAGTRLELIRQSLTAREFFHCDSQYVIQDGKVVIVDEFTGRMMPQRTWQAGLHQLIEIKENIPMTQPSETLARLSFQRFYRFFRKLSGMTGTARESALELWSIYQLPVVSIPENKPCRRKEYPTRVFPDQKSKWQAILEEIIDMHGQGRPVLVGTRNVKASEELARRLDETGLAYRLLNAVRHKEEARIVALAGERAAITIATNMAGRGTDIRLDPGVAEIGGLHVIATECHESRRIDRQLFGRSARQGDPGSARSFVSMEDELIRRYTPDPLRRLIKSSLERKMRGSRWAGVKLVKWAQSTAQRIAFLRRRSVLRMDTWLDDSLSFAHGDVSS